MNISGIIRRAKSIFHYMYEKNGLAKLSLSVLLTVFFLVAYMNTEREIFVVFMVITGGYFLSFILLVLTYPILALIFHLIKKILRK